MNVLKALPAEFFLALVLLAVVGLILFAVGYAVGWSVAMDYHQTRMEELGFWDKNGNWLP